jgi:hypothetical protein
MSAEWAAHVVGADGAAMQSQREVARVDPAGHITYGATMHGPTNRGETWTLVVDGYVVPHVVAARCEDRWQVVLGGRLAFVFPDEASLLHAVTLAAHAMREVLHPPQPFTTRLVQIDSAEGAA